MTDVIEMNIEDLEILDEATGLHPFMIAAVGSNSDLSVVYETLHLFPESCIHC